MKIIRVTTAPISIKYLLRGQLHYFSSKGFEVVAVSSAGPEWKDIIDHEGCRKAIIPMSRQINIINDIYSLAKLYFLFKAERPEIVHSHTPKAGLLAMTAAWFARVPIRIHTVAGLRYMTINGPLRYLLVFMEKATAFFSTQICPNSPSLYQYLFEHRLASPQKIKIIGSGSSNGVDLGRYSKQCLDPQRLEAVKASIQYDDSLIYLLSMGRIVRDKGIEETLLAFEQVSKNDQRLRLILLGKMESELDPISEKAHHLLATLKGVIRVDWSDTPEYYMALSAMLVHASYREGFPSTLLQAGAMGCPIICTNIEGSRDLIKHRQTGLIVAPRDANELASMIQYGLDNPAVMESMATQLRQEIEENYDQRVVHRLIYENYLTQLKAIAIE